MVSSPIGRRAPTHRLMRTTRVRLTKPPPAGDEVYFSVAVTEYAIAEQPELGRPKAVYPTPKILGCSLFFVQVGIDQRIPDSHEAGNNGK